MFRLESLESKMFRFFIAKTWTGLGNACGVLAVLCYRRRPVPAFYRGGGPDDPCGVGAAESLDKNRAQASGSESSSQAETSGWGQIRDVTAAALLEGRRFSWVGKPPAVPVEVPRKKALASSIERSELLTANYQ